MKRLAIGVSFVSATVAVVVRLGIASSVLVTLVIGFAALQARADSIAGTGWKGKGVNNDWSTANNWDSTPPKTDGTGDRNLFFGQGYFNAGNNGFTSSNNNLSNWAGYRITFEDISGQPDVGFTITGNSFTLFDFGGNFPKVENLSNVTQTFTLTSGNTITLSGGGTGKAEINPVNGNIVFSAGTKVAISSPLDIYGNNGSTTFTATFNDVISGGNPITLYNNSTAALNAANTYSGNTNIKNGTLIVGANAPSGSAGALGNSTNAVTLGDTTGTGNASLLTNGAFTVGRAVTVQSGNTGIATIGGNTAHASTYSGNINLGTASGTAKDVTLVAASGGSVDFSGVINENTSVTGNANVSIGSATHTGTVRLSNTGNGYGGITTVSNGATLEVTEVDSGGNDSSLGNSSGAAGNLVLNGGTLRYIGGGVSSTNRLFTFNANGATLDANADVSFTGMGSLVASGTGNRTLTLTGSNNGSLASIIPNPSSGTTGLAKSGSGVWTVSGANTYTGTTVVNNGTLVVSGTHNSGGAYTVGNVANPNGATLAGSGTVTLATNTSVTFTADGNLAPGTSVGTLTFSFSGTSGGLNLSATTDDTGALKFELDTTAASDKVVLTTTGTQTSILDIGTLSFADFAFTPLGSFGPGTYTLFETPLLVTGSIPIGTASGIILGYNAVLSLADSNTDVVLTVTAIPETSAFFCVGVVGLLTGCLALRRRRAE